jgi:hypothetical protein
MKQFTLILSVLILSSCSSPLIITKRNIELYQIEEKGKVGYIDQKGKTRIEPKYLACDNLNSISECTADFNAKRFAVVKKREGYTLIDWKGNKTTTSVFKELIKESDSTFVAKKDGKFGLINYDGENLIPFIFDSQYFIDDNKLFPAKIDYKPVTYDPKNGIITKMPYDNISPFLGDFAEVESNDKVGLINIELELVFDTAYQELGQFSSNLINAKIKDKWYFLNNREQAVFDTSFDKASSYQDGVATVKKEKYGAIDTLGNLIIPFEYEYLSYEGRSEDGDKIFMFCNQEDYFFYEAKCGLINQKKDTILRAEYSDLFYFFDIVEASIDEGAHAGVIDLKKKKVIIPFNFNITEYYDDGLSTLYFSDNEWTEYYGYVNRRNRIIWSNNKKLLKEKLKTVANKTYKQ